MLIKKLFLSLVGGGGGYKHHLSQGRIQKLAEGGL